MYLDEHQVFRSELLDQFDWLHHGFGTRLSGDWPGEYTHLKQIHSDMVVPVEAQQGCIGRGDAIISREPGTLIGVRTADCIPVLLADPNHRAVGVIHAGWRGTVAQIAAKAVRQMTARFGSDPAQIHAAIGPGINVCCFEVGPEVGMHFPGNPRFVDLIEANVKQLRESGVVQIDASALCTRCHGDLFHSFRRDREASGRMVSAGGVKPMIEA